MSRIDRPDTIHERAYKSLWHLLIAGVGVYELRNHKTKLSKVLAIGLIAFHIDGAIADLTDSKPLSRRVLELVVGEIDDDDSQMPVLQSRTAIRKR